MGFTFNVETRSFVGEVTRIKHPISVVLPDGYDKTKQYFTVYMLHGYGGSHKDWTTHTDIEQYADRFNIIIVCPDGNRNSWYVNSKVKQGYLYETYIAKDVVNYIDNTYSTVSDRTGRAIAGYSMGGYGALYIALHHQKTFSVIGSMSGGVDFRPFPKKWELEDIFGSYPKNKKEWNSKAIINNLSLLADQTQPDNKIAIIMDVGIDDFFLPVNRELHNAMLTRNIQHDYTERRGGHNWDYWNNNIGYQLLFISSTLKASGR